MTEYKKEIINVDEYNNAIKVFNKFSDLTQKEKDFFVALINVWWADYHDE